MESNNNEKIVSLLIQVIRLLEEYENNWAKVMRDLLHNYVHLTHSENKKEAAELIRKSMLGGMGSLSDVVLHKDGIPPIEENDRLDTLLDDLYDECKRMQSH